MFPSIFYLVFSSSSFFSPVQLSIALFSSSSFSLLFVMSSNLFAIIYFLLARRIHHSLFHRISSSSSLFFFTIILCEYVPFGFFQTQCVCTHTHAETASRYVHGSPVFFFTSLSPPNFRFLSLSSATYTYI